MLWVTAPEATKKKKPEPSPQRLTRLQGLDPRGLGRRPRGAPNGERDDTHGQRWILWRMNDRDRWRSPDFPFDPPWLPLAPPTIFGWCVLAKPARTSRNSTAPTVFVVAGFVFAELSIGLFSTPVSTPSWSSSSPR